MKTSVRHIVFFASINLALAPLATGRAAEPTPPKGFRAIFNGRNLSGWHGHIPNRVARLTGEEKAAKLAEQRAEFPIHWTIENGELVNDGHGPYATTDEEYGDIELLLEYKTVPKADSGIYLRGRPQVQIWDWNQVFDPKRPNRRPHLGSGGLYNNTPETLGRDPIRFADKPFGQWNQFRIRQIGARTWVWLNNRAVVEGAVMEDSRDRTKPLPAQGPIMLQTHGGEVRWRNIFVREIVAKEAEDFLADNPPLPNPTHYDVSYGPHRKQLLHFWRAESDQPTPVLFFIHGGGWMGGGRLSGLTAMLPEILKAGISIASVEYRFIPEATADGIIPPVKGPLHDAARALQFVRSKAAEWNIDKQRIGASGGSAGACSSLWLAFHPDLADPQSSDPVARESTRLWCAAVRGAQTTLDPHQMKEWTPNSRYGGHAFGFKGDPAKKISPFAEFFAKRDTIQPWIAEYSPYALVTADDPPVHLFYSAPPALGQPQKDPTHTANFGVKLQEHCRSAGVACELVYPGAPAVKHSTTSDYLIWKLKENSPQTTSLDAENWPAWRGADGRAISRGRDLPLEWSTTTNVRWKTPLPAPGNSTPIVWEARIFITQARDKGKIRSLICYDRRTGKQLWQHDVPYPHTETSHSQNPPCSGSPTTDGKLVYASFGSAGVVACNFSGQLVWSRDLGRLEHVFGLATTPVLYKHLLLIHRGPGEPTHIIALDKRTGETVWDTPEVGKNHKLYGSWSTPVIYRVGDHDEFVLSMPGEMKGYDPLSGKELWRCAGLGPSNYPDTAIGDEILLGVSGFRKSMMAVRMGGRGDITQTHRLWHVANTQQRIGSGVVHAGHLYVANATGIAECIDVQSGTTVWKHRLGGNLWGSMLLAGERLYVSSLEGDTFVLAANPKFELLATNSLGEPLYGALAASDGELFLRTHQHLYCISQAN